VLELANRLIQTSPILVISLAGAIGGSGLLSYGETLGIARYLAQVPIRRELTVDSERVTKLFHDSQARTTMGNIQYIFFGSAFDHLLLYRRLAFPHLSDSDMICKHILMKSSGHSEIVTASLPMVKNLIRLWLGKQSSSL
jgi:hypothetical protein